MISINISSTQFSSQKGVALYLALAILALLLAIALGVMAIVIGQQRTLTAVGYSVVAIYAADSGVERELYEKNFETAITSYSIFFDLNGNGKTGTDKVDNCPDKLQTLKENQDACAKIEIKAINPVQIYSAGYYSKVRRALDIKF